MEANRALVFAKARLKPVSSPVPTIDQRSVPEVQKTASAILS
jgi:hypothetical protein